VERHRRRSHLRRLLPRPTALCAGAEDVVSLRGRHLAAGHRQSPCDEILHGTGNLMYTFALEIKDEDKRKSYMKYASRWQSHSNRVNILKDAQVYHPIPTAVLMRISTSSTARTALCISTPGNSPNTAAPTFSQKSVLWCMTPLPTRTALSATYINEIMSGDADRAKFLQKILGYGLTGDTRHECMTILYGVTTRNGKGTLCESVLKVLGDYGCASRPETIAMKSYTNGSQPSEDVARLPVSASSISRAGKRHGVGCRQGQGYDRQRYPQCPVSFMRTALTSSRSSKSTSTPTTCRSSTI
jgi:hypothetical protein